MRIYQNTLLSVGANLQLDEQASHHLGRVLRAKVGDEVLLFNGKGGEYNSVITEITKKGVAVHIESFSPIERESTIQLFLAQGISRSEKMDFVIQKAVELGVNKITPLITARCNVRLSAERLEKRWQHWRGIIQHACEQSGRNTLPVLEQPLELVKWLPQVDADLRFVLDPYSPQKLPTKDKTIKTIQLLLGPEGGLDANEVHSANQYAFKNLQLGTRILRTETATVAAMTALQYHYGDLA